MCVHVINFVQIMKFLFFQWLLACCVGRSCVSVVFFYFTAIITPLLLPTDEMKEFFCSGGGGGGFWSHKIIANSASLSLRGCWWGLYVNWCWWWSELTRVNKKIHPRELSTCNSHSSDPFSYFRHLANLALASFLWARGAWLWFFLWVAQALLASHSREESGLGKSSVGSRHYLQPLHSNLLANCRRHTVLFRPLNLTVWRGNLWFCPTPRSGGGWFCLLVCWVEAFWTTLVGGLREIWLKLNEYFGWYGGRESRNDPRSWLRHSFRPWWEVAGDD